MSQTVAALGVVSASGEDAVARRVRELREAALNAVRAEDIVAVMRALLQKASEGCVQAAKLVLGYTLGRPAPRTRVETPAAGPTTAAARPQPAANDGGAPSPIGPIGSGAPSPIGPIGGSAPSPIGPIGSGAPSPIGPIGSGAPSPIGPIGGGAPSLREFFADLAVWPFANQPPPSPDSERRMRKRP